MSVSICVLITNFYCLLCFAFVKKLQEIEFGLVFLQSVSDIFGAIFNIFHDLEGYIMRYLFYCESAWTVVKNICKEQLSQSKFGDQMLNICLEMLTKSLEINYVIQPLI